MIRISDPKKLAEALKRAKEQRKSVGFVPTMGYLHQGHTRLIRKAKRENGFVVVSLYVNPLQFGPREDFKVYPRNLRRDTVICRRAGADVLFVPDSKRFLRDGKLKQIKARYFNKTLCAPLRPGHFDGVATIVALFFRLIRPDRTYFGLKDYQQCRVICEMNRREFGRSITVVPVQTVREKSGLAVSSRNAFLSADQKREAAQIYRSLKSGRKLIRRGEKNPAAVIEMIHRELTQNTSIRPQYIELVDAVTLERPKRLTKERQGAYLIAEAVFLGSTRLIDNILV